VDDRDATLRPKPSQRTRDLWLDAKWALFEVGVPLDMQMVLVEELTQKAVLDSVDRGHRHLRATIFHDHIAHCRESLAQRLEHYRREPGRQRAWRNGRLVADASNEERYFRYWSTQLREEWRSLRQRRDTAFHRFSITALSTG
jgi:hypothetical protein